MQSVAKRPLETQDNSTRETPETIQNPAEIRAQLAKEFNGKGAADLRLARGSSEPVSVDLSLELEGLGGLRLPSKFADLGSRGLAGGLALFFRQLPSEKQAEIWGKFFGPPGAAKRVLPNGRELSDALIEGSVLFKSSLKLGKLDRAYPEEARITAMIDQFLYKNEVEKQRKKAEENARIREQELLESVKKVVGEPNWDLIHGVTADEVTQYDLGGEESQAEEIEEPGADIDVAKSATPDQSDLDSKLKESNGKSRMNVSLSGQNLPSFHQQELERYSNPTVSYTYKLPNGEARWVAPVCKKVMDISVRPRDHFLLLSDRPSAVTILSLVRDAAAKMPEGYGTRGDICELLKESQFINPNIDEERMSTVVSGALDRLHYEKDPCVRFDTARKLWVYLHCPKDDGDNASNEPEAAESQRVGRNKKVKIN